MKSWTRAKVEGADHLEEKILQKALKPNPNAEWLYTVEVSPNAVRQLLARGWEVVSEVQGAMAMGSSPFVRTRLRKRNPRLDNVA